MSGEGIYIPPHSLLSFEIIFTFTFDQPAYSMAFKTSQGRRNWLWRIGAVLRCSQVELDTHDERYAFLHDEERSPSNSLLT